jgi:UDP-2,3-diacylglucosamine hydrolase
VSRWFIADLHLSPARPDISALFAEFLQQLAEQQAESLYILGDLVDAWIGDDDHSEFALQLQQQLRQLTDSGVPVYFMAGNRDFLIGDEFAKRTGVHILQEPTLITVRQQPTLLLHGDSLCTADTSYQRFRRVIRARWLTKLLLALPLSVRMGIARRLRAASKTQQPLSPQQLEQMDVTAQAVEHMFEHYQVKQLIHGHTHRPAVHQHRLSDGSMAERIVLGDWYQQGSMLKVDDQAAELLTQPL